MAEINLAPQSPAMAISVQAKLRQNERGGDVLVVGLDYFLRIEMVSCGRGPVGRVPLHDTRPSVVQDVAKGPDSDLVDPMAADPVPASDT